MPPTTFREIRDPLEAKTVFASLIERFPTEMSIIASNIDGLIADPSRYENARWWSGTDADGVVTAALMRTPPHPLHIGLATAEQAQEFAKFAANADDSFDGVGGRREPAEAFADAWAAADGRTVQVDMALGSFDLPVRPRLPFAVVGSYRLAREADLALVDEWAQDFADAVDPEPRRAPTLAPLVAAGRVGLWEVDGQRVSMAYASTANGGVTRVSGVWTPPEHRGHGYASAVVAAISDERMDAGERCTLFTDLANLTSNKIYQALGYRRIGDNVILSFV